MKSPEIAELKQKVSLKTLFEAHGVQLQKKGRAFFGQCPFHSDKDPSLVVNESEGLWHCMGCDAGGDAVTAIEKLEKVNFKEAVQQLREKAGCAGPYGEVPRNLAGTGTSSLNRDVLTSALSQTVPSLEPTHIPTVTSSCESLARTNEDIELLSQIHGYYARAFSKSQEAITYLRQRGFTDNDLLQRAGAGFVEGNLRSALPDNPERIQKMKALGLLNDKSHESFLGCIVFPLRDLQGRITGIYGRRTCGQHNSNSTNDNMGFDVKHQYMKGPKQGIWYDPSLNCRAVICECVIDALSVMQAGIPGAVACHGTNGFTDEHEQLLKVRNVTTAVIAFDGDDAGRRGAGKVADRLRTLGIAPVVLNLPEGRDLNEILVTGGPQSVCNLVGIPKPAPSVKETADGGLYYENEGRTYEVKGIKKDGGHIRATVRAVSGLAGNRFHVDALDLVVSRQRASFAAEAASLFGVDRRLVTEDLLNILAKAETLGEAEETEAHHISAEERQEAESFLNDPELLSRIAQDMEALGLVGEDANKQLVYLVALSRRLPSPLSAIIMSRSSAGKSTLLDKALELTPPEEQVRYTRLTSQALFYKGKDSLKHKVMVIEEQTGAQGADYALRSMQSAKRLTMAVTIKDPQSGMLKTVDYEVEGPVAVMISTTEAEIHYENATRAFCISVDESREQTQRIHHLQRQSRSLPGMIRHLGLERLKGRHHNAQRLLAPVRVINPFVEHLRFPDRQLQTRREHEKYLTLIETITYLYQKQRGIHRVETPQGPIQVVETAIEDIMAANRLMEFVLRQTLSELSGPTRELLSHVRELVRSSSEETGLPEGEVQFSRREIREQTGWSDWQVKTHIQRLEELEYICPLHGQRGRKYVYELGWKGELAAAGTESTSLVTETELREIQIRLKEGGAFNA